MSSNSTISIPVDVRNPGQFFACCGLLELAERMWGAAECWFEEREGIFVISAENATCFLDVLEALTNAKVVHELTPALVEERRLLEAEKKQLKGSNKSLPKDKEHRRKALGEILREGSIVVGAPFELRLDWWQLEGADVPKTFAGSQEVFRIAQAARASVMDAFKADRPFDFAGVIRPFAEVEPLSLESNHVKKRKKKKDNEDDKAEPFYFDSRHGANALPLDIGFSPNELGMESKAYPAVELLCLIGLQRCRPAPTDTPSDFEYFLWDHERRVEVSIAPAAVCGFLGQRRGYRFENAYRTDQKKHKGYRPAVPFTR